MHDGADVRDPRGSGGTLRSVLLIKAFTLRLGSGILFDLDCVKSISDNQREVLAFGGFHAQARRRRSQIGSIFSNHPLFWSQPCRSVRVLVQQAHLVTAKLRLNYFYCWDFSDFSSGCHSPLFPEDE